MAPDKTICKSTEVRNALIKELDQSLDLTVKVTPCYKTSRLGPAHYRMRLVRREERKSQNSLEGRELQIQEFSHCQVSFLRINPVDVRSESFQKEKTPNKSKPNHIFIEKSYLYSRNIVLNILHTVYVNIPGYVSSQKT